MKNCKSNNVNTKIINNTTAVLDPKDREMKLKYSEAVYKFLFEKYESIGGINRGRGFKDKNDMAANIPIWRLQIINYKIASVMMFKVTHYGKKMVAYACADHIGGEFKRADYLYMLNSSYAELSDGLLVSILKLLSEQLHKYVLNAENIMEHKIIHPLKENSSIQPIPAASIKIYERLKKDWPELLKCSYIRKIGNKNKLKVLMGTPRQTFANSLSAFPA